MTVFPWSFLRGRTPLRIDRRPPLAISPQQQKPPERTKRQAAELARFRPFKPHALRSDAGLQGSHPAVLDGRTIFPSTVVSPAAAPRVLVGGHNNCKIGRAVRKGPWRGLPIFTLTLEERATCPRTCHLWRECYGNAMPFSRRHRADATLVPAIDADLVALMREHRSGIVVRLHILGDFWSLDYLRAWVCWMTLFPQLRVFGFTAHQRDTELGAWINAMNREWPQRWAIRFSVPPTAEASEHQATTIWRQATTPTVPEGIICPAQTGATDACATCGLCWAPAAADKRIVFIGHGMLKRARK